MRVRAREPDGGANKAGRRRIAKQMRWPAITGAWTRFFFAKRDPSLCGILRIAYAILLLINVLVWLPDLNLWFSEEGVMPLDVSRALIDPDTFTIFQWLPKTNGTLWFCYGLFVGHIVLLLVGVFSRVQAAFVFVWLVSFQHRHHLIMDGEDTLFRLFGFFMILIPCGYAYSLDACWRPRRGPPPRPWALRLFQIQVSLIYISTAIYKMLGQDWRDGTALYYVSRLDDLFGRFPVPKAPFESWMMIRAMTWTVVAIEILLPLTLWIGRSRRIAIVIAILFHLSIDYAMNLLLFHWLMIVGLLSFLHRDDWRLLSRWWRRGSLALRSWSQG